MTVSGKHAQVSLATHSSVGSASTSAHLYGARVFVSDSSGVSKMNKKLFPYKVYNLLLPRPTFSVTSLLRLLQFAVFSYFSY